MATFFNFFDVLLGRLSVTYAIAHMLPTDLLLNMGSTHGLTMVFSTPLVAIIWNLGTWFFSLSASSSHTLIDMIIGIGLTNALLDGSSVVDALNLRRVAKAFSSLIVSPIMGLVITGGLIFLLRRFQSGAKKRDRIHRIPKSRKKKKGKRKPPFWTRIALIISAAGMAFSYGASDGQKGIGLVMLVLVRITPTGFVVNMNASGHRITRTHDAVTNFKHYLQQHSKLPQGSVTMEPPLSATLTDGTQVTEFHCHPANAFDAIARVKAMLPGNIGSCEPLSVSQHSQLRRIILCISNTSAKLAKLPGVNEEDQNLLKKLCSDMLNTIEYAPVWIIMAVTLALSIGTMIGWRRIVMAIGEKIDERDMAYAQGMTARMTAAVFIGLTSYTRIPVSTTHIPSSAVVGTMMVDGGRLQHKTVTSILMTQVFILPAAIFPSDRLYQIALQLI